MTTLVGLAFTSPSIAVMVIERSVFRVHYYQGKPDELHAFLQEQDKRKPIVVLTAVNELWRLRDVKKIHGFLLCEDPEILFKINGCNVLDAVSDTEYGGYKQQKIRPEQLNAALVPAGTFQVDEAVLGTLRRLSSDISLRELYQTVTTGKDPDSDFRANVCWYLVGAMQKKSWVSRVQKVALSAGVPVDKIAELERFIETAPSAEMLWRAYYDHAENGVPFEDAVAQFEADAEDLQFIVDAIGVTKGHHYYRNPHERPMVFRPKRKKVKTLKKTLPPLSGSSVLPVVLSADTLATETANMSRDTGFDLQALLDRFDTSTGNSNFSRVLCAYLCGLVDSSVFVSARESALADGASKKDISQFIKFMRNDTEADGIWKAYCYYSFYVGVTAGDAASKYGISLAKLDTVLKYKPMAYVFDFVMWPDELS